MRGEGGDLSKQVRGVILRFRPCSSVCLFIREELRTVENLHSSAFSRCRKPVMCVQEISDGYGAATLGALAVNTTTAESRAELGKFVHAVT